MKKRGVAFGIALALALLALLVGGVLLLRDDVAGPPASPDRGDSTTGDAETKSGPDHPADDALADSPDRAAAPDASRDVLADNPPPTEGPTVTFVESETGRPLPDAGVWLVLRSDVSEEEWTAFDRYDADADALMKERGLAIELDALATATLTFSRSDAMLLAVAGERHLCRPIALDHTDRLLLKLVRREKLTLLAIDPDGRRQSDVPLSLQTLLRGDPWQPPTSLRWRQSTDDQGEAIVPQGSELLDEHLDADGLASVKVLVAALAFPCRDPSATLVDPRTACAEPVKLVTPPRSRLRLHAVDARGSPMNIVVDVLASIAEPPPVRVPVRREWSVAIAAASAVELVVEAEAPVRLTARSRDGRFLAEETTVLAPALATTLNVKLVMKPASEAPCCVIHVVGSDGHPLAAAELAWQLDDSEVPNPGLLRAGRTDSNGDLRMETAELAAPRSTQGSDAPTRRLQLFEGIEAPASSGAKRHGVCLLPPLSASASVDLGIVRLTDVPMLVAGRVVDRDGKGVIDVDVRVDESVGTEGSARSWTTRTGAGGRFLVRARSDSIRLSVWPSRDRWYRSGEYRGNQPVPISVNLGEADLEITLHQKGFARGRLLVDPGISIADLYLTALPIPAPDVRSRLEADGRFSVEGAPGVRSLTVASRLGGVESIAQVDGFRFDVGRETVDPRLDPIDLRKSLRQVELEVRAESGEPIASAVMYLFRAGMGFGRTGSRLIPVPRSTDPFGRAMVTTPTDASRVILGTPEHLFTAVGFDSSFQEVTLAPAILVRVTARGPVDGLVKSGRILPAIQLASATGGDAFEDVWRSLPIPRPRRLDESTFEFKATMTGRYWISWRRPGATSDWDYLHWGGDVDVTGSDPAIDVVNEFTDKGAEDIRRQLGE